MFIAIGCAFSLLGLHAFRDGFLWYWGFDARMGTFGYAPTIQAFFLGLLLVVMGILSLWAPK
jgi:hypothetical protein